MKIRTLNLLLASALLFSLLITTTSASVPNPCVNTPPSCNGTQLCQVNGTGNSAQDSFCQSKCNAGGSCLNGGVCTTGACVCPYSFGGNFCEIRNRCGTLSLPYGCYNGGVCEPQGTVMNAIEYSCIGCTSGFGSTCGLPTAGQAIVQQLVQYYTQTAIGGFTMNNVTLCNNPGIVCNNLSQITQLNFGANSYAFIDVTNTAFSGLVTIRFDQMPVLSVMDFHNTGWKGDVGFFGLGTYAFPSLTSVQLQQNAAMTGAMTFFSAPLLQVLNVGSTALSNVTIGLTVSQPALTTIDLSSSGALLLFNLANLQALTSLTLSGAKVNVALNSAQFLGAPTLPILNTLQLNGVTGLSGSLPAALFTGANFGALQTLNIGNTGISGTIPAALFYSNASSQLVTLDLSSTSMSGTIPTQIANSVLLQTLKLSNSQFTGSIPSVLGNAGSHFTHVTTMNLAGNNFNCDFASYSGYSTNDYSTLNTKCAANCTGVYGNNTACYSGRGYCTANAVTPTCTCYPGYNKYSYAQNCANNQQGFAFWDWFSSLNNTGPYSSTPNKAVPVCVQASSTFLSNIACSASGDLITTIQFTNAASITGTFPSVQLSNWTSLTQLTFQYQSNMTGTIPTNINLLSSLQIFELYQTGITGSIPTQVCSIPTMTQLYLTLNPALGGAVPSNCNFTNVQLPANNLTGTIPSTLIGMSGISLLDLSGNALTGSIPTTIGTATSLQQLLLNGNQLSGTIPTQLGSLSSLTAFQLKFNQLTGSIPTQVTGFNSTVTLFDVSHNLLTGSIPTAICTMTNLAYMSAGNNALSGSITPCSAGQLSSLTHLSLSNNLISGTIPTAMISNLPSLTFLNVSFNSALGGDITTISQSFVSFVTVDFSFCSFIGLIGSMSSTTTLTTLLLQGNDLDCNMVAYSGIATNDYTNYTSLCASKCNLITGNNTLCYSGQGYCGAVSGNNTCTCYANYAKNSLVPNCAQNPDSLLLCNWFSTLNESLGAGQHPMVQDCAAPLCGTFGYTPGNLGSAAVTCHVNNVVKVDFSLGASWAYFFGTFPTQITQMSMLSTIKFGGLANLTGTIPTELGTLSLITTFSLTGLGMTGTIPTQLFNMNHTRTLALQSTKFSGQIPEAIINMPSLTSLTIDQTAVSGSFPLAIANLTNLLTVTMTKQGLTGNINTLFSSLPVLYALRVNGNALKGQVTVALNASLTSAASSARTSTVLYVAGNDIECPLYNYGSLSSNDFTLANSTCALCNTTTPVCSNGGVCTQMQHCDCPAGFIGSACQTNNFCASSPCLNAGTCTPTLTSYTCTCAAGYLGATCADSTSECRSAPCLNGATCVDGFDTYTCQCPVGFSGANCQNNLHMCTSSPCLHSGTCIDGVNVYTCTCPSGYSGARCQNDNTGCNGTPCKNGGTCAVSGNGTFTCTCPPLFNGTTCQISLDGCLSMPCKNGATCQNVTTTAIGYACTCVTGYSDQNCTTVTDNCLSSPCENGGTCANRLAGFTCTCPSGISGSTCQVSTAPSATADTILVTYRITGLNYTWLGLNLTTNNPVMVNAFVSATSKVLNVVSASVEVVSFASGSIITVFTVTTDNSTGINGVITELIEGNTDTASFLSLLSSTLPSGAFDNGVAVLALDSSTSSSIVVAYVAPTPSATAGAIITAPAVGTVVGLSVMGGAVLIFFAIFAVCVGYRKGRN